MFVDFLNLFQDPAGFFRSLPLWVFFAIPHVFNLLFLFVVWVVNLRTTSDSLPEGTSEDVALFFDGITVSLSCMVCFVAIDMPTLYLSMGIFEANGVVPGGGVAVGYGIWLVLAVVSTLITVYCSVAIRKHAYRR
jgi:hypothetical protein